MRVADVALMNFALALHSTSFDKQGRVGDGTEAEESSRYDVEVSTEATFAKGRLDSFSVWKVETT